MNFSNDVPIYIQIINALNLKILRGEWTQLERIPSIRDVALFYQVNPNTVMRAYERLQSDGIIFNRRGLGYYLSENATERLLESARELFVENELPAFFKKMDSLSIGIDKVNLAYQQWHNKNV